MFSVFMPLPANSEKLNTPLVQQKISEQAINSTLIEQLQNPNLQKVLLDMLQGSSPPLTEKEATNLLMASLNEPSYTKVLVSYLLDFFRKENYSFDKHQIMLKALKCAPLPVIDYLLEEGVYDANYLNKEEHYNIFENFPLWRSFYMLIINSPDIDIIPSVISIILRTVNILPFIVPVASWINTKTFNFSMRKNILYFLQKMSNEYNNDLFQKFSSLFCIVKPLLLLFIKSLHFLPIVRFFIGVCMAWRTSIRPSYLFSTLLAELRPNEDKQALALLLLKHGANPHIKAFFVKKKKLHPQMQQIQELFKPCIYRELSVLHLAAQLDLLPLVKKLVELGIDTNIPATFMEDTINYPSEEENTSNLSPPINFVTTKEMYYKNNPAFVRKTPFDFAPRGSQTAQYLKSQGGKYFKELIAI